VTLTVIFTKEGRKTYLQAERLVLATAMPSPDLLIPAADQCKPQKARRHFNAVFGFEQHVIAWRMRDS
jgi:hypothetical protein